MSLNGKYFAPGNDPYFIIDGTDVQQPSLRPIIYNDATKGLIAAVPAGGNAVIYNTLIGRATTVPVTSRTASADTAQLIGNGHSVTDTTKVSSSTGTPAMGYMVGNGLLGSLSRTI